MADDDRKRSAHDEGFTEEDELSPGLIYMPYVVMEELVDKCKLLGFDQLVVQKRAKPLNKHYFSTASNPGEQFFAFVNLACFLASKCGYNIQPPQEFDDPNVAIAGITQTLKSMAINTDFPPNKLKSGSGDQVLFVLDRLADEALKRTHFKWKKIIYPADDTEDEIIIIDDDAELTLDKVEEDLMMEQDYDDDDDQPVGLTDLTGYHSGDNSLELPEKFVTKDILESNIVGDNSEWKQELERVQPLLKVVVRADAHDWRSHLEQMQQHKQSIKNSLNGTRSHLETLYLDITKTLDKIQTREKYLNAHLEEPLVQFKSVQEKLSQNKKKYQAVSGGLVEKSKQLQQITEELDSIKHEMEERGTTMTDGSPLVNIKKALTRLRTEIVAMDVRLGVVQHTLLHVKLKERNTLNQSSIMG